MASSWEVTGQVADQTTITTAGQVVTGHQVYFITGTGYRGSVFVPDEQYTPANVKTLINAAAARGDQVAELTSGQ